VSRLPSPLALVVGGGVLGLSLLGAGVYALVPLAGDDREEARARAVVEDYVRAWGESRCQDAAALIAGPRDEVVRRCRADARTQLRDLAIEKTEVVLDGDRGTARLTVTFRSGEGERTESVHEEVVRVDGLWRVAWSG